MKMKKIENSHVQISIICKKTVTPQNLFFDYEIALGGTANVPELV